MMDYKEILNKINLREQQILEHLAFLRYFDENPVYLHENILKQAVIRYEIRNSGLGKFFNKNSEVLLMCMAYSTCFLLYFYLNCHEILHVHIVHHPIFHKQIDDQDNLKSYIYFKVENFKQTKSM